MPRRGQRIDTLRSKAAEFPAYRDIFMIVDVCRFIYTEVKRAEK